jgi:hypothetical protein
LPQSHRGILIRAELTGNFWLRVTGQENGHHTADHKGKGGGSVLHVESDGPAVTHLVVEHSGLSVVAYSKRTVM